MTNLADRQTTVDDTVEQSDGGDDDDAFFSAHQYANEPISSRT